jgi:hypothetical protein
LSIRDRFHQALCDSDVGLLCRIWKDQFPDMPQPANLGEAEIQMRMTQTKVFNVPFKVRAYAHRWLTERGLPSQLPDHLKPKAERAFPIIKTSVGIAFSFSEPLMAPAFSEISLSMENAVLEAYNGKDVADQEFVKVRMEAAKQKTMRQLFGTTAIPK